MQIKNRKEAKLIEDAENELKSIEEMQNSIERKIVTKKVENEQERLRIQDLKIRNLQKREAIKKNIVNSKNRIKFDNIESNI